MNPKRFRGWCQNGCGEVIKSGATKYCSLKCRQAARRSERIRLLECGQYSALQITQFLRRYLIGRLGECCTKCGWAERHPLTRKVPIEVEHIDGDWKNYHLENLTLLCPNCHALTPTFRGLNRGRGRAHRLGGRSNPLSQAVTRRTERHARPTQEVLEPESVQLKFEIADVAEGLNAPHL
jgi:hypothetical protein